jgi:DNA-binding transcriptional MerR regulator
MDEPRYTVDELAEKTGFSRRTIRYYVQEGLIEPPAGRGRGGFYNDSHVAMLLKIKSQQEQGFSLGAIARLAKSQDDQMVAPARQAWARYEVVPGVELHVSRDVEQRGSRKLLELLRAARSIMKEGADDSVGSI